ncbi:MAG TPA: hypothetical protein G4O10_05135 [Dehalococcoidia bacterium]|nr:hypothetical protein [Dehalococcoidia bacterium]
MAKKQEFAVGRFIPSPLWDELIRLRKNNKRYLRELVKREGNERARRNTITDDGRLIILAADHTARRIMSSGIDKLGMANRINYIGRILRVICGNPQIDGVMGTPDVLEDLLLFNYLNKEHGGDDFLDRRLLIGCMNRLGLKDAIFELDDGLSGYGADYASEMGIDGVKLMFRYDANSQDSRKTLEYCVQAMNECHKHNLPVFLEAMAVEVKNGKVSQKEDIESLLQVVCIANGLSTSSLGTWLKLPYIRDSGGLNYSDVIAATSYPVLVLGGAATGQPEELVNNVNEAMLAGASGGLLGRQVLFPGQHDPYAMGRAISEVIHNRKDDNKQVIDKAMQLLATEEGEGIDRFSRLVG